MRIRFFLITLAVLTAVSMAVTYLHASIIRRERLSLIDQQMRETAAAIIDSELVNLRKFNMVRADNIISQELGESRLGKFFIVRNNKNEIIYQNSSGKITPLQNIPRDPTWITINTPENYIRVLNLKLPSIPDRTLQVGAVVNHELVALRFFSRSTAILFLASLLVGSLGSLFFTSFLLRPIAKLSEFISTESDRIKNNQILALVPPNIADTGLIKPSIVLANDEYQKLITGFNSLIEKVNRYYKNSKLWAYQMAHELKTPLTLINLESEALLKENSNPITKAKINSIQDELNKVSETIGTFLSWAELENSARNKHLFANRISHVMDGLIHRLDPQSEKFSITDKQEFTVLSNPLHLEQLLLNLLTNSLKYSDLNSKILISLKNSQIEIKNSGSEIPASVLARLGEPFNKGSDTKGSGLGLAWVNSICKLYGWNLAITSQNRITTIMIQFQSET